MELTHLLRVRAQRAWRVVLAGPSPLPPPVDAVPLADTPQRRRRSTDAGPWTSTKPYRWTL